MYIIDLQYKVMNPHFLSLYALNHFNAVIIEVTFHVYLFSLIDFIIKPSINYHMPLLKNICLGSS